MEKFKIGFCYRIDQHYIDTLDRTGNCQYHIQLSHHGIRPYYVAMECNWNKNYVWVIPISHEIDKYKSRLKEDFSAIYFGDFQGDKRTFLVQNMIPVKKTCACRPYITNHIHVHLSQFEQKILFKKTKTEEFRLKNGNSIYKDCPDWYDFVMNNKTHLD